MKLAVAGLLAVIPRIGLDTTFFNGQATINTDYGPSHDPWTAMPGSGRTTHDRAVTLDPHASAGSCPPVGFK